MATGLLGFNPYGGGVELDFSSKPLAYAIQLEKEARAKDDALEKYFRDIDKSITPTGMRQIDVPVFTKAQSDNKSFYIQNKDKIKRPELDNGQAYSEYIRRNNQLLEIVNKSKSEQEKIKDIVKMQYDAKKAGEIIDDDTFDFIARSQKSIADPDFVPFDLTRFSASKPFDPNAFSVELYKGKPLSESAPTIKPVEGQKGMIYSETRKTLDKSALNTVVNDVYARFDANKDKFRSYINKIKNDPEQVELAAKKYQQTFGVPMPANEREFAVGFALTLAPELVSTGEARMSDEYKRQRELQDQMALARYKKSLDEDGQQVTSGNLFDKIDFSKIPLKIGGVGDSVGFVDGKLTYLTGNRKGQIVTNKRITKIPLSALPDELISILQRARDTIFDGSETIEFDLSDGSVSSMAVKSESGSQLGGVIDKGTIKSYQEQFERKDEDRVYDIYGNRFGSPVNRGSLNRQNQQNKAKEKVSSKFSVDGKIYNIPSNEVSDFLKSFPKAKKL